MLFVGALAIWLSVLHVDAQYTEYYYDYGYYTYKYYYYDTVFDGYELKHGPINTWETKVFTNFLTSKNLKLRARHGVDGRSVTNVSITVKLIGLADLDEKLNNYKVSLELAQQWNTPFWEFASGRPEQFVDLDAPAKYGLIWTPGTYFVNEIGRFDSANFRWAEPSAIHRVTRPNYRMRINRDGTILFVQRLTLTLSCQLDLRHYPLDQQICPMKLSSFPHTTKEVVFHWSPDSVLFKPEEAALVEYEVSRIETTTCRVHTADPSDVFPCLQADFHIKRRIGSYLLQFYIPSIFFVSLSWLTFWIDIDAVVARISFAIFLVVNMAAQMMFVLKRLPPVAYVKAIDVWMVSCLIFISGSLIEYAVIKVRMRNTAVKTGRRMTSFFPRVSSSDEEPSDTDSGEVLEVPAITRRESQQSTDVSDRSTELPAVTTEPVKSALKRPVTFDGLFSGSDESEDFEPMPGRRSGNRTATFSTDVTRRTTSPAQLKTPATPAPNTRRKSVKLPRNPTTAQRIFFRIRKKFQRLQTNKALLLDVISRVAFPLAFAIFNAIYWTYYLHSH